MSTRPLRLSGHRLAGPTGGGLELADAPAFADDPRRACNPGNSWLFVSENRGEQNRAKQICGFCPVRRACGTWAVAHESGGVWAGYVIGGAEDYERAVAEYGRPAARTTERVRPAAERKAEQRSARDAAAAAEKVRIDTEIRELWARELPDAVIALRVGLHPGAIVRIRKRLGLPTLYGPGGRRVDHELVGA
jgi:hypothetical protein